MRLLDFRAEVLRGDSESRRRDSWVMRASRCEGDMVSNGAHMLAFVAAQRVNESAYLVEQFLDGCLGLRFIFCRLRRYGGRLGKLRILVEIAFCLYIVSFQANA